MNKIFTQKKQYYNLRIANLLSFPKVIGSKYGKNTFVFRAIHLWNQVPDAIKMNQTQNASKTNSRETDK